MPKNIYNFVEANIVLAFHKTVGLGRFEKSKTLQIASNLLWNTISTVVLRIISMQSHVFLKYSTWSLCTISRLRSEIIFCLTQYRIIGSLVFFYIMCNLIRLYSNYHKLELPTTVTLLWVISLVMPQPCTTVASVLVTADAECKPFQALDL